MHFFGNRRSLGIDKKATFFVRKTFISEKLKENKYEFYFCDSRNFEFLNIDYNLYEEEGKRKVS